MKPTKNRKEPARAADDSDIRRGQAGNDDMMMSREKEIAPPIV